MDDETREALEMTKDELAARFAAGEPAKVRKGEDFVQRMKRVVDESTRDDKPEKMVLWPSGEVTDRIVVSPVGTDPIRVRGKELQQT